MAFEDNAVAGALRGNRSWRQDMMEMFRAMCTYRVMLTFVLMNLLAVKHLLPHILNEKITNLRLIVDLVACM